MLRLSTILTTNTSSDAFDKMIFKVNSLVYTEVDAKLTNEIFYSIRPWVRASFRDVSMKNSLHRTMLHEKVSI